MNLIVLPYRAPGQDVSVRSAAARLSALVQQEALFSMLKYGSVAATELFGGDSPDCATPAVLERIGRSGNGGLRPGHAVVLLWGRLYEDGEDLYVQTYLRFLRRGERELVSVSLPRGAGAPLELEAELPPLAVALAPRKLTQGDLAEIERHGRETLRLHDRPGSSASRPLATSDQAPLAYGVLESSGDWMRIRAFISGEEGWVLARQDDAAWALRRFLPELAYLDGVVGYLRLRTAGKVPLGPPAAKVTAWMERAFDRYAAAVGPGVAPDGQGLAHVLVGHVRWTERTPAKAAPAFRLAAEELADSAEATVLAALTTAASRPTNELDAAAWVTLERGLLAALAVDPRSPGALAATERLYAAAESAAAKPGPRAALLPHDRDELARRLVVLRAAPRRAASPVF